MTSVMRIRILCVLLAIATTTFVVQTFGGNDADNLPTRSFSELNEQLEFSNVDGIEFTSGSATVTVELADGDRFRAIVPPTFMDSFVESLVDYDPPLELRTVNPQQSVFSAIRPWITIGMPLLFMGLLIWLIWARMGSRGSSGFDATKRLLSGDETPTTFDDVAGADEAIVELSEIRDFLKDPTRFHELGARIPKGVLLYGPPGPGKTLLARAVAGEADVPFYTLSGSDFVESFVGVGASRVRKLFESARENAPAIIFVDEIDAVGRHRGGSGVNGNEEREQTLNQLLVEMDGFDAGSGVIFIAATNRPDILDPALLRPGRFDRQVGVDTPDLPGRREIVAVHSRGKKLAEDVSVDTIARRTPGFTGADLANLLNEAALLTARRRKEEIGQSELDDALDRVIAGPEKSNTLSGREQEIIAYHEAGHALVGHVLPGCDRIHKVSVVARGRALGWTLALPDRDRVMKSESELHDEMSMLLGGRIAEELIFADPTTGAANDIERVTRIARNMVTTFGMSRTLGLQKFGAKFGEAYASHEAANYSDEIASQIDGEIRAFIATAANRARAVLIENREVLDHFAEQLLEHETLDEVALAPILDLTVGSIDAQSPVGAIDLR